MQWCWPIAATTSRRVAQSECVRKRYIASSKGKSATQCASGCKTLARLVSYTTLGYGFCSSRALVRILSISRLIKASSPPLCFLEFVAEHVSQIICQ